MPLEMKVQAIDPKAAAAAARNDPAKKSRLKRLLERQFPSVLRIASAEKNTASAAGDGRDGKERDDAELEPSSVCLDRMVLSFIEESNEKPPRCGRRRCNCFNGNCDDSSDDDVAGEAPSSVSAAEILKGLVLCVNVVEKNLLSDTTKIVEKGKIGKGENDSRRIVTDGLIELGYDASICKSRWEKTASFPAGEYEYVDVIVAGERILVDVDFRSEFEIARSTKNYRTVLQSLPSIFVGKADRLKQIVAVVSEAARQSLRKKGLHFPPWRKPEYLRAKWLSTYHRTSIQENDGKVESKGGEGGVIAAPCPISAVSFKGQFEMRIEGSAVNSPLRAPTEKITVVVSTWQPPAVRPKAAQAPVVTGLASVLKEKV